MIIITNDNKKINNNKQSFDKLIIRKKKDFEG